MSKIIVTGDCHGDFHNLSTPNIKKLCGDLFPPSVAIILGDAAFIFETYSLNPTENYWIDWLNEKPWITVATLGNHEGYERIYKLPLVDFFGGKAYQVSKNVFYLKHGEVYNIEGNTFFNFGGADSIDKAYRKNRITWWAEEIPTQADFYNGMENLKKVNFTVDYVISHTCPTKAFELLMFARGKEQPFLRLKEKDPTMTMLDEFEKVTTYKKWLFGHFHFDIKLDESFRVMFNYPKTLNSL